MSEQTPEGTDQSEAADDAQSVQVPNIREGARSGLDHEPLTPRKSTLLGRETVTVSEDDGTNTVTETFTDEVTETPDALTGDGSQQAGGSGEPSEGTEVSPGETGEVSGDGSGQALPPVEEEPTAPEGTPIGDAAEQETTSGDEQSGGAAPADEPAASPDSQEQQG